jgi:hypothetical protein
MTDLLEFVSLSSVECLNEKAAGDWGKAIKQGLRDQGALVLGASRRRASAVGGGRRRSFVSVRTRPLLTHHRRRFHSTHKQQNKNKNKSTESDTDEQLLLHIPFTQRVKLSGIAFAAPEGGKAPKSVRLFVNRPTVGFSDAESTPAAAELSLSPDDLKGDAGKTLALKPARFTGVDVLSIFVENNQGEEETTVLSRLTLFGSAGETFDVAAIKKIEEK